MEKHQNLESLSERTHQNQPENNKEKLIPGQKLRDIYKTLGLLGPEKLSEEKSVNWKDLYKEVDMESCHSMLEFTGSVREAVRDYVIKKIPELKEKISRIEKLDDDGLLDALTHNWFEGIDEVSGARREVLLAVAAHIVKRIEILAEKKLLNEADPEKCAELDIDPSIRDLLVELLDASAAADPLFVRFLAYAQLSDKPPKEATATGGVYLSNDPKPHTMAELFPHETQFIAKRFSGIAAQKTEWRNRPGGDAFAEYLDVLSGFYETRDPAEATEIYEKLVELYRKVITTDFPVILTPTTEGHYNPPYFDPELKVSISNSETRREEEAFRQARNMMAEDIHNIGVGDFEETVRNANVKTSIVLGGFGSSLEFPGVAQEEPASLLFLEEQIREYDSRLPEFLDIVENSENAFQGFSQEKRKDYIEKMSRMGTMLHEFSHPIYPRASKEGQRLGRETLIAVDEVKAETLWRPLVPQMIEQGLTGTREQWAQVMLVFSLMYVKDQPDGDSYYSAGVYNLNDLFEKGIIKFENKKVTLTDLDAYYAAMKDEALEVLSLFQDKTMTEHKAKTWMKKRCVPSETLQQCIDFVRTLPY